MASKGKRCCSSTSKCELIFISKNSYSKSLSITQLYVLLIKIVDVGLLNYHIDLSINSCTKLKLFFGVPFHFVFISSYLMFLVVVVTIFNISNIIN